MSRLALLVALTLACGPTPPGETATSSSTSAVTSEATSPTGDVPTGSTTAPLASSTTGEPPNPATGDPPSGTTADSTTGDIGLCDVQDPACPEGQKCNVYTAVGDDLFHGKFKCVPLAPDPKPPHAPCDVFGDPLDGTDDCESGAVCLYPNDHGVGECFAFCDYVHEPACSVEGDTCVGPFCQTCYWGYCDQPCDLLDPMTCGPGEVCVLPIFLDWTCQTDASGEAGQHGDPCEFANGCDPGHACVPPDLVADCQGDVGCCAIACDTTAPDTCPDQDQGMSCTPYYAEGQAPTPELAKVGLCAL